MYKGQELTFLELWEWMKDHDKKRWRLYALGGSFGFLNHLRWDEVWTNEYHELTDGGHPVFAMVVFDTENHFVQEIPFGGYPDLVYKIVVRDTSPLEIQIEWKDLAEMDSKFTIFQEL